MLDEGKPFPQPADPAARPTKRTARAPDAPEPALLDVVVLERLPMVRSGVRLILEQQPGITVSGEANSIASATVLDQEPDLIVHGLFLSDGWGPEVVRRLRSRFRHSAILVLTVLEHPLYVHLCMTAGATGYVTKSSRSGALVDAVRAAGRGESYVDPALGAGVATWAPRRHRNTSWFALTSRETEVLELLALGHTNKETAASLGIALRTVETHRANIFQKLGITRRAELVRFATSYTQRSLSTGSPPDGPAGGEVS